MCAVQKGPGNISVTMADMNYSSASSIGKPSLEQRSDVHSEYHKVGGEDSTPLTSLTALCTPGELGSAQETGKLA